MTQSPLGHDPSPTGPFGGSGSDQSTTQQHLTTTQGAPVSVEPAVSAPDAAGEEFSNAGANQTGGASPTLGTRHDSVEARSRASDIGNNPSDSAKVETAKGEAKQVADSAIGSGKQVAQTAKDEAQSVVAETRHQAASLLDTVRNEVGQQAGTQQHRIAEALHGLAKELGGMASASEESGPLTDLAQQASRKGGEVAHWLQDREPADVLESVRSYGRRHPVSFLALCGLAGIVAGRLTRSTVAIRTSLDTKDNGGSSSAGQLRSSYATRPVTPPVSEGPAPVSTGVYGGSVETTAPADPYDRPPAGPGYVGTH